MAPVTENSIKGTVRTEVGKGSARRARREGLIPAVLYGHGHESVHLDLPGHEVFLLTKDSANAVVSVNYGTKSQLALVKAIQRHPVRRDILHVDLLAVSATERVEVEVPISLVGEPAAGNQLQQEEFTLLVSAPAISIPDVIEVSVEGLEAGNGRLAEVVAIELAHGHAHVTLGRWGGEGTVVRAGQKAQPRPASNPAPTPPIR